MANFFRRYIRPFIIEITLALPLLMVMPLILHFAFPIIFDNLMLAGLASVLILCGLTLGIVAIYDYFKEVGDHNQTCKQLIKALEKSQNKEQNITYVNEDCDGRGPKKQRRATGAPRGRPKSK